MQLSAAILDIFGSIDLERPLDQTPNASAIEVPRIVLQPALEVVIREIGLALTLEHERTPYNLVLSGLSAAQVFAKRSIVLEKLANDERSHDGVTSLPAAAPVIQLSLFYSSGPRGRRSGEPASAMTPTPITGIEFRRG